MHQRRVTSIKNRSKLKKKCSEYVNNLEIKNLFLSFDELCKYDIYNLGTCFEKLFVSSLAVKYYLWTLLHPKEGNLASFTDLYDFTNDPDSSDQSELQLDNLLLDLSEGIAYPEGEIRINSRKKLPKAVIHNILNHNAHHDIILPTELGNIPVSAKASFRLEKKRVDQQLLLSKKTDKEVELLIWLYLGNLEMPYKNSKVKVIDGSGVCNGLAHDLFVLVKRLIMENNRKQNIM